jgi:Arc/MetJ family transcription regulator
LAGAIAPIRIAEPILDDQTKVYDWCMARTRTNIEIDDDAVQAVMERFKIRTKTEAVDLALRHLAGQPMTRKEALAMQGANAIDALPPETPPEPT